jgi:hypothetical protein
MDSPTPAPVLAAGAPPDAAPDADPVPALLRRYRGARERRRRWESLWQACYDHALPHRLSALGDAAPGVGASPTLYDGTAPDAVDQLAASMVAQLTPPWARWFDLAAGSDLDDTEKADIAPVLEQTAEVLRAAFAGSNFAVEIHQCYMDLVTIGTACLAFEEAPPGEPSAFRFAAVPMADVALDEGPSGRLDTVFRSVRLSLPALRERYPGAVLPPDLEARAAREPDLDLAVLDCIVPDQRGYAYTALLLGAAEAAGVATDANGDSATVLAQGRFAVSPYLCFRWLKAPGEVYGRSPVMKALPDIRTANKVVELVLKNASIAVTGIWQADDDGVLNPATVRLVPGTIIPKAVGSSGLTPLKAAGDFDVSQLVLEDLRARIRHALLADRLGQPDSPGMTATEVVYRAAEMARVLGASYGRLQAELLTPLVRRGLAILRRRGEVRALRLDGRLVDLVHASPLAQQQRMSDAHATLTWVTTVLGLGEAGARVVDIDGAARWLARALGVPDAAIRPPDPEPSSAPGPAPGPAPPPPPAAQAAGDGLDWSALIQQLGAALGGGPGGGGPADVR